MKKYCEFCKEETEHTIVDIVDPHPDQLQVNECDKCKIRTSLDPSVKQ